MTGTPGRSPEPGSRTILWLLALVIAMIAYGSFYPFRFEWQRFAGARVGVMFASEQIGRSSWADIIGNLLFYIPLGLVSVHALPARLGRWPRALLTLALGALLSVSVEFLQQVTVNRTSSILDVVLNVVSTIAGISLGLSLRFDYARWPHLLRREQPYVLPLLVVVLWIAAHTIPFIPNIGWWYLTQRLESVRELQFSLAGSATWAACYLIVSLALRALVRREAFWSAWALLVLASLAARLVFLRQHLELDECLGMLLAFALIAGTRRIPHDAILAPAFHLVWLILLIAGVGLSNFSGEPQPFHSVTLGDFLKSSGESGYVEVARKLFLYTGALWLAAAGGMRLRNAAVILFVVALLTEWTQRYLPGRMAEVTDPFIVLVGSLIVAVGMIPTYRARKRSVAS